jgi:hypothetical protein
MSKNLRAGSFLPSQTALTLRDCLMSENAFSGLEIRPPLAPRDACLLLQTSEKTDPNFYRALFHRWFDFFPDTAEVIRQSGILPSPHPLSSGL